MLAVEVGQLDFGLENGGFQRHEGTRKDFDYPRETIARKPSGYNQQILIEETAMRQLFLSCCLALSALAVRAEVIDIDNAQLAQMTKNGVTVIDIRTKPEWEETGIVHGSKLLTFFDERGKADPGAWLDKVKPLVGQNDPVIVICRTGNRTKPVSQFLSQQAGYAKVYNVKSGIKGWIADKGTVVPAAQSIAACQAAKTC
jgi:rhodanese-related sulfurtransferase